MATKDFDWISEMCRQEGLEVKRVKTSGDYLFEGYFKAKRSRRFDSSKIINDNSMVPAEKRKVRREYLLLMKGASKKDHKEFVWEALSVNWIDEKIEMIINEMAGYDEVGTLYKTILEETYLKEKPLKGDALYRACGVGRSAYFERRAEAITLFGILTYKYALRREKEDIATGLVDATTRLA